MNNEIQTPPLTIGQVTLTVNDLEKIRDFYEQAVGLHLLRSDGSSAELGVDDTVLLELQRDPSATKHSRGDAGLFHTAFLLPSRRDLARWLIYAGSRSLPLLGASDHIVSEALYLSDPEGNGVEIYSDRSASSWTWHGDTVEIATEQLDLMDLIQDNDDTLWDGMPKGSTVGHVHLQVGALAPAEEFYASLLGFDITCHYRGAAFYSTGRYHHHLATNIWNSHGALPRQQPSTGLADLKIFADNQDVLQGIRSRLPADRIVKDNASSLVISDPWNTQLTIATR